MMHTGFYIEFEYAYHDLVALSQAWLQIIKQQGYALQHFHKEDLSALSLKEQHAQLQKGRAVPEGDAKGLWLSIYLLQPNTLRLQLASADAGFTAVFCQKLAQQVAVVLNQGLLVFSKIEHRAVDPFGDYWQNRLQNLPAYPSLPAPKQHSPDAHYIHVNQSLSAEESATLRSQAESRDISLSTFLLAVWMENLAKFSRSHTLRVDQVLANRLPLFPYYGEKASYATSTLALPYCLQNADTFEQRTQLLNAQSQRDAAHLSRATLAAIEKTESQLGLPCYFVSAIEQALSEPAPFFYTQPDVIVSNQDLCLGYFCQVWEMDKQIFFRISFAKERLDEQVVFNSVKQYHDTLQAFVRDPALWTQSGELHFQTEIELQQAQIDAIKKEIPALETLSKIPESINGQPNHPSLIALKQMGAAMAGFWYTLSAKGLPTAHPPGPTPDQIKPGMSSADIKALYDKHIKNLLQYHQDLGGKPLKQYQSMGNHLYNVSANLPMEARSPAVVQQIQDSGEQLNTLGQKVAETGSANSDTKASLISLANSAAGLGGLLGGTGAALPSDSSIPLLKELNSHLDAMFNHVHDQTGISQSTMQAAYDHQQSMAAAQKSSSGLTPEGQQVRDQFNQAFSFQSKAPAVQGQPLTAQQKQALSQLSPTESMQQSAQSISASATAVQQNVQPKVAQAQQQQQQSGAAQQSAQAQQKMQEAQQKAQNFMENAESNFTNAQSMFTQPLTSTVSSLAQSLAPDLVNQAQNLQNNAGSALSNAQNMPGQVTGNAGQAVQNQAQNSMQGVQNSLNQMQAEALAKAQNMGSGALNQYNLAMGSVDAQLSTLNTQSTNLQSKLTTLTSLFSTQPSFPNTVITPLSDASNSLNNAMNNLGQLMTCPDLSTAQGVALLSSAANAAQNLSQQAQNLVCGQSQSSSFSFNAASLGAMGLSMIMALLSVALNKFNVLISVGLAYSALAINLLQMLMQAQQQLEALMGSMNGLQMGGVGELPSIPYPTYAMATTIIEAALLAALGVLTGIVQQLQGSLPSNPLNNLNNSPQQGLITRLQTAEAALQGCFQAVLGLKAAIDACGNSSSPASMLAGLGQGVLGGMSLGCGMLGNFNAMNCMGFAMVMMPVLGTIADAVACLQSGSAAPEPGEEGLVVVSGATIQCTNAPGMIQSLRILPLGYKIKGDDGGDQAVATVNGKLPFINVPSFGTCLGTLGPCCPVVSAPFTPGSTKLFSLFQPVLRHIDTATCAMGGIITIADPGQTLTSVP